MTKEELIKQLDDIVPKKPKSEWSKYQRQIVDEAIKTLEQESRWIPISEKLPEENRGVLVWCPAMKNIYCACYEDKQWWIFGSSWDRVTEEIVAWKPLPKVYSEVKE